MGNQKLIADWQNKIAECCSDKLGRRLSSTELQSIQKLNGFQALEMIEDMVSQAQPKEIEPYLAALAAQ